MVNQTSPHHKSTSSLVGADLTQYFYLLSSCAISVLDPYKGHIRCPGAELHTQPTAHNHCTVYKNGGILRINCFHKSCGDVVEEYNRKLRARCTGNAFGVQPLIAVSHPVKASSALGKILQVFPWSYQDIASDPVGKVTDPEPNHHIMLFSLFPPDDILWVAESVQHSGHSAFATNFRPAKEWLAEDNCPGAYICPNAFKMGVVSRSNENIVQKRFLVVESDTLSKNEMGAVFRFLMSLGYRLKAVVDTAGKSLHGWFVHPGDAESARLKLELPALGCDPQMFSISQPVRLPGALRNGQFQKLIYFNPNA